MKKVIFALAFMLAFSSIQSVSAATCGDPNLNHGDIEIFDGVATSTVPAVSNVRCDGNNPENIVSPWGTNSQVPHMKSGDLTTDEGGLQYICPEISRLMGCSDISRSDYYRTKMIETGRQLRALGFSGGVFAYWINLSR